MVCVFNLVHLGKECHKKSKKTGISIEYNFAKINKSTLENKPVNLEQFFFSGTAHHLYLCMYGCMEKKGNSLTKN